jgi:hypothetical protein
MSQPTYCVVVWPTGFYAREQHFPPAFGPFESYEQALQFSLRTQLARCTTQIIWVDRPDNVTRLDDWRAAYEAPVIFHGQDLLGSEEDEIVLPPATRRRCDAYSDTAATRVNH